MKQSIAAFFVGVLFALGLGLAGMTQTEKVIGFLDIFGKWDPSLMFVMVGAIAVHSLSYRWIRKRPSPLLTGTWHLPTKKDITPALVGGSALFGMGWGLGGYCPGPAVTSLASMQGQVLLFVGAMLVGMLAYKLLDKKLNLQK